MKNDDAPPPSDRRRALRHIACFPAYLEVREGEEGPPSAHAHAKKTTMIADLGEGGALLFVRKPDFQPGEALRLELYVALDSDTPRSATGHVVRIERLPDERVSLWTHQVAVAFDSPITISDAEVAALEERRTKLGIRR